MTVDPVLLALTVALAAVLLVGAVVVGRATAGGVRPPAARLFAVAAIATAAQALTFVPAGTWLPTGVWWAARTLGTVHVAAAWAFAALLVTDGWRWRPHRIVAVGVLSAWPVLYLLGDAGWVAREVVERLAPWGSVPAAAAAVHLAIVSLAGLPGDLVAERRIARRALVLALALGLVAVLVAEGVGTAAADRMRLAIGLALAVGAVMLLVPWPMAAWERPVPAVAPPLAETVDRLALERLRRCMADERPHLDPELDLDGLARRVGLPPHRLRRVIHGGLGHRHFADFLAEARLGEVRQRLSDPALARRPILTLALESGFPSLATFNRVFKARLGCTPSAFRAAALAATDAAGTAPSSR